jgi:DNA-binding NtrC family response regulator
VSTGSLSAMIRTLRSQPDLEGAAATCLGYLLRVARETLEASEFRGGHVRRAMLHVRPTEGYAGLLVLEAGATVTTRPGPDESLLPSVSAWRHLEATHAPVAVDVLSRSLRLRDGPTIDGAWTQAAEPVSSATHLRLLKRGVSHVYALPLVGVEGLGGMITLELQCVEAADTPFIWPACTERLETAVDAAAPHLLSRPLPAAPRAGDDLLPVVGPSMSRLIDILAVFAAHNETLLIQGETGTGKSRIARWCHAQSVRAGGPFEVLDLLGVPAETQMGELFGWKRGAFTGAARDHDGFVARADGGTLFIDEVDKLTLGAQAALLTLLEDHRYRPLGGGSLAAADVRFIVGTNADLRTLVREGVFREDLYYRVNVLPVRLPPLRERRDEIARWAEHMLQRVHAKHGAGRRASLDPRGARSLEEQAWPGNLRQLDNVMRRAYALASSQAVGDEIRVEGRHVDTALAIEGERGSGGLLGAMRDGMAALVTHLQAREPRISLEGLDLGSGLLGLLLAEAVSRTGSREAAFELLGLGELVKNRNHHRTLHREWGRTLALFERLGLPPPADLVTALDV